MIKLEIKNEMIAELAMLLMIEKDKLSALDLLIKIRTFVECLDVSFESDYCLVIWPNN